MGLVSLFWEVFVSVVSFSTSINTYFEMGKNKGGKNKVNAVFRVAGGKAAKAKAKFKAQPVATNLKKLNTKSRSTVETLDKDLMEVRDILVSAPAKKEVQELKIKESTQHVPD